jgi:16S rRNA (guanine(966)-N(2))-methyltransferase RsmD
MRISGGRLRGRVVRVPELPGVRPTAGRVREALFSMLGQDLTGWSMLDAFGGSGLMAFEAASRGADPVVVCERSRRAASALLRSAEGLGLTIDLRSGDARATLRSGAWDLVFLDPPYAEDPAAWVEAAASAAREVLVIEHRSGKPVPSVSGSLERVKQRRYGDSTLSVYRPRAVAGVEEDEVVP